MKEHCKEIAGALKEAKEGTLLEVTVQPGSRREGIEISDGSIIVRVREPPPRGELTRPYYASSRRSSNSK